MNARWNGDFPQLHAPPGGGRGPSLTSQPRVTLPPPPIAKVVVSCFFSISTGMFQRWALSLPEPGPPHSGWSCPGMGPEAELPTAPPASRLPPRPARWVTLGRFRNLSGPLKNKRPAKRRPLPGLLGLGLISSSPGAGIISRAHSRRPRLVLSRPHRLSSPEFAPSAIKIIARGQEPARAAGGRPGGGCVPPAAESCGLLRSGAGGGPETSETRPSSLSQRGPRPRRSKSAPGRFSRN